MRPVTLLASLALAASLTSSAGAACVPPPSGIVGFWPADGTPTDVVGGAPTDRYYGATYTDLSVVGPGFWFPNGESNLVYITPTDAQHVTAGMTMEGWIYFQPIQSPCGDGNTCTSLQNATIAASGPVDGVSPIAWQLVVRIPDPSHFGGTPEEQAQQALAHRELVFAVRRSNNGTVAVTSTIFPMATPDWMHVAGTYDASTGVIALYVNGGLMNAANAGAGNIATASGDTMFFGVLPFEHVYQQPFKGAMDEMALYNRALTVQEIDSIVNAWTDGKCYAGRGGGGGSTCYTAGNVTACASSWTEPTPGCYLASGNIAIGPQGTTWFEVKDGELKACPSSGFMSYKGTLVVPTIVGDIPLYSTQGSSRWPVTTAGTWYPAENNGTFTRLLDGLPSFNGFGWDLGNFPFAYVPPEGIGIDLGTGCVSGTPSYALSGLPESGSFSADGWFNICASDLTLHGGVSNFDVSVAGCNLHVTDASLSQAGPDLGFLAHQIDLSLPLQGNAFRAQARDLFVSAHEVRLGGGAMSLPPLRLGPFDIGYAEASVYPRTVGGYRVCGSAGFEFPQVSVGADISFALLGGELQRGCVSGTFPPVPIIPGLPVYVDRLGGCVTLPTSTPLYQGEECNAESFYSQNGCLTGDCNLGLPEVALTTRVLAGPPVDLGDGYFVSADPVTLAFGPQGFRASCDVNVLGSYFGTGEVCVSSYGAEMCAAVDVGGYGILTGDAHVWIDDEGISGSFNACIDPPVIEKCLAWHCWDEDPAPYSAGVTFGNFRVDKLFGSEQHYGITARVSACGDCYGNSGDCWPSGTIGIDVRTGGFFFTGVRPLPHGAGRIAQGVLPPGDRLFGPFAVPGGVDEVIFLADTDGGALDMTVTGPSGILDASSPGVRVEKHEAEGITLFGVTSPAAGSWIVTVHDAPEGAVVEADAYTEAQPAVVMVTEPAIDTDSLHVAWDAMIPATAADTTLRLVVATSAELAAAGAGRSLHEEPLAPGPGSYDITPADLETGTWWVVVQLDDGLGHVSSTVAPGRIVVSDTEAPLPPASASVASLPEGARVTWLASPSPDVVRYDVVHQDPANALDAVVVPAGNELSLDVGGLADGEQRRFFVRAIDRSGNASEPLEAGVAGGDESADGTAPDVPLGLALTATSDSSLHAEWNASSGATGYRVSYGIHADLVGGAATEGASPLAAGATSVDLSGFTPGAHVFVAVAAVDAAGNVSALSEVRDVLLTSGADTDGDGLPDDWEMLWFSSLDGSAGGSSDTDGDWLDDGFELSAGLDPLIKTLFPWGDLAPAGAFDGKVDISDAVRALRLSLELEQGDQDTLRRAEVSPATLLGNGKLRPTRAEPMRITIADVVLILRASVGLSQFETPFAPEPK